MHSPPPSSIASVPIDPSRNDYNLGDLLVSLPCLSPLSAFPRPRTLLPKSSCRHGRADVARRGPPRNRAIPGGYAIKEDYHVAASRAAPAGCKGGPSPARHRPLARRARTAMAFLAPTRLWPRLSRTPSIDAEKGNYQDPQEYYMDPTYSSTELPEKLVRKYSRNWTGQNTN